MDWDSWAHCCLGAAHWGSVWTCSLSGHPPSQSLTCPATAWKRHKCWQPQEKVWSLFLLYTCLCNNPFSLYLILWLLLWLSQVLTSKKVHFIFNVNVVISTFSSSLFLRRSAVNSALSVDYNFLFLIQGEHCSESVWLFLWRLIKGSVFLLIASLLGLQFLLLFPTDLSRFSTQQSSSQQKKLLVCTTATLILAPATMSAQSIINEALKQINATLQGYVSHFDQQDKTVAEIKWTNLWLILRPWLIN